MRINKDSLKARANNIAKKFQISQNVVYNRFFYDAFLSRLSRSKYRNQFILKGGLYLSSILGIETRSTMDVDFYIRKIAMEKDRIVSIVKEIVSENNDDSITFKILNVDDIRKEDSYGGFQIILLGQLENVKCQFGVDIATGDPIIPSDKNYVYKCLVTEENLSLKAYSLESIVSEKLETVLARSISNSRSKDYYDLYILRKTQFDKIDKQFLIKAFQETCHYRCFHISRAEALALIDEIDKNQQINIRWTNYCKNVKYTGSLPFKEVIITIREWIEMIL